MPKDPNIQFLPLIEEVFDSVFKEYGFEIQGDIGWVENEDVVTIKKNDIALIFHLGRAQLFYSCSLGIKLSGELAEKATSNLDYRGLGVTAIAKCLDASYKQSLKKAQTKEELKELLENNKEVLLKYCKDILLGDVSVWQSLVDCITDKN